VSRAVFYNGSLYAESDCAISPLSRAVHYGDGVFETMRSSNGCVFRLSEHLERLCSGLRLLRIPLPDPAQLAAAADAVLRANALSDATIKIIAFRDGPPGPTPAATDAPCVLITAEPMDHDSRTRSAAGAAVMIHGFSSNQHAGRVSCSGCRAGRAVAKRYYFYCRIAQRVCPQHCICGGCQLRRVRQRYAQQAQARAQALKMLRQPKHASIARAHGLEYPVAVMHSAAERADRTVAFRIQ